MDRIAELKDFILKVMNPCRIPPNNSQPSSITKRPRTRISRLQVTAIGVMSITLIGILGTGQMIAFYSGVPSSAPVMYNTESVIVKFGADDAHIWDLRIRIANATSRILFEPDSICIVRCDSGGYALACPIRCQKNGLKTWGVLLCGIDDVGEIIWKQVYDELDIELELSLVEVQSEGFAVAGTTRYFDEGSNNWIRQVFIIRTNSIGSPQWVHSYTELTGVKGHSLVACGNGDLAIVGTTEIHSNITSNAMLARINENGSFLWKTPLGSSLNDEGNSLIEYSDAGFIVVGSTQVDYNDKDVFLSRTAANGSVIWNKTYDDNGISVGWSICSVDNGRFAVTGLREQSSRDTSKTLFMIVDSSGSIKTRRALHYDSSIYVYGYYDHCCGHSIVKQNGKGLLIAGIVRYNQWIDEWGMMILRTDSGGKILSNFTYGENSQYVACSIVVCENQGYAVAGVSVSPVG
ncbi:MAG: hypothetical protein ACFFBJ_02305 [Promethearchaeota archaeon]